MSVLLLVPSQQFFITSLMPYLQRFQLNITTNFISSCPVIPKSLKPLHLIGNTSPVCPSGLYVLLSLLQTFTWFYPGSDGQTGGMSRLYFQLRIK